MAKRGKKTLKKKGTSAPTAAPSEAIQFMSVAMSAAAAGLALPRKEIVIETQTPSHEVTIRLGIAADGTAYALRGCKRCGDVNLTLESRGRAIDLFRNWHGILEQQQYSVNSDPRSPDFFHSTVDPESLPDLLKSELGVDIR